MIDIQNQDLYIVVPEEGKHIAFSNDTEGAYRGVFLDDITNKPCGSPELIKVSKEDLFPTDPIESTDVVIPPDNPNNKIGYVLAGAAITACVVVAPYVKKACDKYIVPKAKKAWRTVKGKISKKEVTTQVQSALVVYKENMSSEEAKKELVEAFILQAMSAKKLYRVSNANIVNKDGENVDVSQLINELTNPTTLETINSLLITNPNMVSAQNLKDLSSVLGYNTIKDNHFIPITKEALCYGLTNK